MDLVASDENLFKTSTWDIVKFDISNMDVYMVLNSEIWVEQMRGI